MYVTYICNVDGEITTEIYRSDLLTFNKNKAKTLDKYTIEFKLNDDITYDLKAGDYLPYQNDPYNDGILEVRSYGLYKINEDAKKSTLINDDVFNAQIASGLYMFFLDENIGFITSSYIEGQELGSFYRTDDGGKTFEKVDLSNIQGESIADEGCYITLMGIPYEENGELFMKFIYSEDQIYRGYVLCKSADKGITWSINKVIPEDTIQNKS